jgi:hypothetical protein
MHENIRIRDKIIMPFMATQSLDIEGMYVGENRLLHTELIARPRIRGVLSLEGWNGLKQWMYKDRRVTLLWPVFDKMFPQALFVIVRRRDEDIINSCMKTAYMNRYVTNQQWQTMVDGYKSRFEEMKRNVKCVEVFPDRMITGDYSQMKDIVITYTGCLWDEDKVKQYIEPRMWRKEVI